MVDHTLKNSNKPIDMMYSLEKVLSPPYVAKTLFYDCISPYFGGKLVLFWSPYNQLCVLKNWDFQLKVDL